MIVLAGLKSGRSKRPFIPGAHVMYTFQILNKYHALVESGICATREEAIEIGLRYVNLHRGSMLVVEPID